MNKRPVRQGDVLLLPVARLPKDAQRVPPEGDRLILARGEATGHHHSVAVADAELYETANAVDRWLKVTRATTLTHQEHGGIALGQGVYKVIRQREYSPSEIRRVAD